MATDTQTDPVATASAGAIDALVDALRNATSLRSIDSNPATSRQCSTNSARSG